jgi:hypothetical protein
MQRSNRLILAYTSTAVTYGTILPDGRVFVEKLSPTIISIVRISTSAEPFATINGASLYLKC